jgi:excisionase family DNA binding protein
MRKTILSTADVARLFNVTETTVKRWADEGALKCQKTPGGHRKFEMRHVVEFSTSHNFEPVGALELQTEDADAREIQMAVLNRDFNVLAGVFVHKALSPDVTDLYYFLSYLYQHRIQLWELYDLVLSPGLGEIGALWARGEITVSKEHMASYETLDALAKLQSEIMVKPRLPHTVVCACVDDEDHEIGLRCAANIFESEGWRVHYLGARTPYKSIISTIEELEPTTVCLSSTLPANPEGLRDHLRDIYATARSHGVTVILRAGLLGPEDGKGPISDLVLNSMKDLLGYILETREQATTNG